MDSDVKLATEKFLAYYEVFRHAELAEKGKPLQEYKPTDPERLMETFANILGSKLSGLDFVSFVLHHLVWRQCLGNANHRTSVLVFQNFLADLGVVFPHYAEQSDAATRFQNDMSRFTDHSKEYLERQNEWGYGPREFETRHAGWTRQTVEKLIGNQSVVWEMIGAQRLRDFISRSEMSG